MPECPTDYQLAALADGALSKEEAARIRRHAAKCPDCSHALLDALVLAGLMAIEMDV